MLVQSLGRERESTDIQEREGGEREREREGGRKRETEANLPFRVQLRSVPSSSERGCGLALFLSTATASQTPLAVGRRDYNIHVHKG